jgi:hypothetical protein
VRRSTFIIRRFVFLSKGKTAYRRAVWIVVYLAEMKEGDVVVLRLFLRLRIFQKTWRP